MPVPALNFFFSSVEASAAAVVSSFMDKSRIRDLLAMQLFLQWTSSQWASRTVLLQAGSTPTLNHFLETHLVFSTAVQIHCGFHLYRLSYYLRPNFPKHNTSSRGFALKTEDNEIIFDQPTSCTHLAKVQEEF